MAAAGELSWRSIQICRTVLRAALADAVEEGLLRRSPAARVPMPRSVAKPPKEKAVSGWDAQQVARFLAGVGGHRWAIAFRLGVLYGLRRSEVLALRWDDFDPAGRTLRIDEGLVAVRRGAAWTNAKNRALASRGSGALPVELRRTDTVSWHTTTGLEPAASGMRKEPLLAQQADRRCQGPRQPRRHRWLRGHGSNADLLVQSQAWYQFHHLAFRVSGKASPRFRSQLGTCVAGAGIEPAYEAYDTSLIPDPSQCDGVTGRTRTGYTLGGSRTHDLRPYRGHALPR